MFYGELAHEMGIRNPRTLNHPLDSIGRALLDLGRRWGRQVPPIQALVINKSSGVKQKIKNLWDKLPIFRDSMTDVPTLHVPNKKSLIKKALEDKDFMVSTKSNSDVFFFKC